MTYPNSGNDGTQLNLALDICVTRTMQTGQNFCGAVSTVADYLDVSPETVRFRVRGRVTGASNIKRDLLTKCWSYLDNLADRQRAWLERLTAEVEELRAETEQPLPLENNKNGRADFEPERAARVADMVQRADRATSRARRSAENYQSARAKRLIVGD